MHHFTAFLSAHHIIHECNKFFFGKIFDDLSRFLGMFRGINKVIGEQIEALSRKELEKVIWANARLNNRTGELITGDLLYDELHSIVLYCTVSLNFI
jgi:hypothetical protein